ncbi:MAG: lamin tail domain-containing protein, partial [Leptospiraceae bacterium]|nr:lamin tail domain-containing protein [Leptospiraceae bacterium]
TDFETYWNIDTTHTDPNSLYYLFRKGKDVRIYPYGNANGMNFVLIDAGTRNPQLYVASHPISGDAESKTDGVFLVLEYGPWVLDFADFFARLQALSVIPPAASGDSASGREVVISELMWMGAVRRDGTSSPYEYVELYNNSDRVINLTDWKLECGANGAFTDAFVLSSANEGGRVVIGPGQYLVLTDDTSASADANAYVRTIHTQIDNAGSNAISDSADQCRLVDSASNVIDTAGEPGKPFLLNPDRAGKVDGDSGAVRSMERTDLAASGSDLSNWHTNSHSRAIENGNILLSFAGYSASSPGTYGTPGYANSANKALPGYRNPARNLKINEFYYNGSTDYWLEIYNTGTESINLATNRVYFIRDSDCDLSNGATTADPLNGTIAPGGFFLLSRDSAAISGSADQTTSAALNTDDCIALIFSNQFADATDNRVIDFIGFDNSGSKENGSTLTLSSGIAVSRCGDGADTDVNANDFSAQSATPKAGNQCVVPQGIFYTTSLESGDPTFTKLSGAGTFSATGCPGSLSPRSGSQAFHNTSVTTASNDGGRDMESSCIALPNTRPVQLSYYHIADLATLGGSSLNTRARLYWFTDASCTTPSATANTLLGSGGQNVSTSGYGNYLQSTAVPSDATYVRIRIMVWSSAGAASNGNWCVDDVSLEGL